MFDLFWILELGHRLGLKAENIKLIDFFFLIWQNGLGQGPTGRVSSFRKSLFIKWNGFE